MLKSDTKNFELTNKLEIRNSFLSQKRAKPYRKGVMDKENVRRLMIRAKKLVTEAAKHIIFEQSEFDKQELLQNNLKQ